MTSGGFEGLNLPAASPAEALWNLWYTELHRGQAGLALKIKQVLFSGSSRFQKIDIFDSYEYGRVLILYGSVMLTEKDEFVYHEMIAHPALFAHPAPKKVLIVGGGDGGTLREVLKHQAVQPTLVEIDEMVVAKSRELLPFTGKSLEDPRAKVVFDDAARFVSRSREKWQVILVDSTDPIGPAEALLQKGFFEDCAKRLADDGILVAQTESPFYHPDTIRRTYETLREIFPVVAMYLAWIPTYPSGLWSFAFCSKKVHPLDDLREGAWREAGLATRYYNPEVHRAAFALPGFVRDVVGG